MSLKDLIQTQSGILSELNEAKDILIMLLEDRIKQAQDQLTYVSGLSDTTVYLIDGTTMPKADWVAGQEAEIAIWQAKLVVIQ